MIEGTPEKGIMEYRNTAKIAFLAPKKKWSIYYKFLEYKKFIEEMTDISVDVFLGREVLKSHTDYDWIIGAVKRQRDYENELFKQIRDRFIGLVTGYECRNRVTDWSIFKYLWFWADCYIDDRFKDNTVFVEPFGVDHNLFKPLDTEKKFFACFVGNDEWPKKRIKTFFIPLCRELGVNYYIVNGLKKWVAQEDLPLIYNMCDLYLSPSIYEAGPAPVLEAASCGVPIVACNSGFAPMFTCHAVITCESWNDYIQALETLKTDDKKRRVMGREARKEVLESWTWEKRIPSLLKKLEALN